MNHDVVHVESTAYFDLIPFTDQIKSDKEKRNRVDKYVIIFLPTLKPF